LRRAADDCDTAAANGQALDLRIRARVRQDVGYASRVLREAFEILTALAGSSGMGEASQFSQILRDFSTASLHGVVRPTMTAEVYGKVLCGVDPGSFSPFF
jgi:hypothetical protein